MLLHFIFYQTIIDVPSTGTSSTLGHKRRNKTKEKIESLLEQVVGSSGALFTLFQEFTNFLLNIDRNFDTLLNNSSYFLLYMFQCHCLFGDAEFIF